MGARGRKSAAELTTLRPADVPAWPDPPAHLSEEVQAEWRAVVTSLPPEYFSPPTFSMLEAYCCHAVMARRIAQRIQKLDKNAPLSEYGRLLSMHNRESRALASIAVRLGLAHSTARPLNGRHQGPRPWDKPWID